MTESLLDTQITPPTVDPNKNYVEELVGEGKKFKTVEDLARGKYEADLHIALKNRQFDELTNDYKKLRDDYNATPKLQEVLDRILAAQTSSSELPPKTNEDNTSKDAFDLSQIDARFEQKLLQIEAAKKAQANTNLVKERLQEKFGDGFASILQSQTQKLGLSKEKVDELIQTAPETVFRLLGVDEPSRQETFQAPPRASQSTTNFAPTTNKRGWSHWRAEQKKQPNLFSDPKAHSQMMEDIKAIGEKAFYAS